jgi:hypothetical protein
VSDEETVTAEMTASLSFSWRYGVIGVYKDRELPLVHIYPLPFVRVSVTWSLKENETRRFT